VAKGLLDILGFDMRALHVDDVEGLRETHQILEIRQAARAPSAVEIGDIGRPGAAHEAQAAQLQIQIAMPVAPTSENRPGRRREGGRHELAPQPHDLRGFVHPRAGLPEDRARFGQQDHDPQLFENAQRRILNSGDLRLAEDILGTERIAQIAVVGLAGFLPRIGRPPGTPALASQILSLNIDHSRQTGRAAEAAARADPIRRFI
jgi:hypothetical protein